MEKFIRDLFTDSILGAALQRYDIPYSKAEILDGFESFIYKVQRDGVDSILRIGHDSRRSPDLVQGESEFLNHLALGGLSVPQVLPSNTGRLVETIKAQDGSHFLTTLFEKAPGSPPSGEQWNTSLFHSMGVFMGQLHRLSKPFKPSQARFFRYDIEKDLAEMEQMGRKYLPQEDLPILQAYLDTVNEIRKLPKDPEGYGLCHIDFHGGNFFITPEGQITLFDFDDCQYAWFVYDIAMALFYTISHDCTSQEKLEEASTFLSHFWRGYQVENNLNPTWLSKIPLFLRLREIDLYMLIHRSMDLDHLDPWCTSYMDQRREKIINEIPYCDIDYAGFY